MGLQIRLTHSLGQRLIEIQPRSLDQPIVVGRGPEAEVQIPSANVAKTHCLLFVHEGRWVVQDAGSPSGTYLNGEMIAEALFLNSGDVITIGNSPTPPTVEIDPFGLGALSIGEPEAAGLGQTAAGADYAPPQYGAPQPHYGAPLPQPGGGASSGFVDSSADDNVFGAAPAASAYGAPQEPASGDPWQGVKQETRYYIPKKKTAPVGVIVGVITGAVVIAGILLYAVLNTQKNAEAEKNKPKVIVIEKEGPRKKPNSIFDMGNEQPSRNRPTGAGSSTGGGNERVAQATALKVATPQNNNPAPVVTRVDDDPQPAVEINPAKQHELWQRIEESKYRSTLDRINACLAYHKDGPNEKLKQEALVVMDKALDELWWERLASLFKERDGYQEEIKKIKDELAISRDAEYKAERTKEMSKFTDWVTQVEDTLKEQMHYTSTEVPNPADAAQIAKLTRERDAERYEKWKKWVSDEIRRSHGTKLPWRQTR